MSAYLAHERDRFASTRDAVTGLPLDAQKNLVDIGLRSDRGLRSAPNAAEDDADALGMRTAANVRDLAERPEEPAPPPSSAAAGAADEQLKDKIATFYDQSSPLW